MITIKFRNLGTRGGTLIFVKMWCLLWNSCESNGTVPIIQISVRTYLHSLWCSQRTTTSTLIFVYLHPPHHRVHITHLFGEGFSVISAIKFWCLRLGSYTIWLLKSVAQNNGQKIIVSWEHCCLNNKFLMDDEWLERLLPFAKMKKKTIIRNDFVRRKGNEFIGSVLHSQRNNFISITAKYTLELMENWRSTSDKFIFRFAF